MIKNSNKNHFLVFSLIIFFSFSVSILIFSPISFINIAKALNPSDYNKLTGDSLGVVDWNRLDADFVAKSGDTMGGNIDMGNNRITNLNNPAVDSDAVSRGSMNTSIATAISAIPSPTLVDTSGNPLKVVCGGTVPGLTNWQVHTIDAVYVDVDTSLAGFTTTPNYFVSLNGSGYHHRTTGSNSIFNPGSSTFRLYVMYTDGAWSPTDANTWQWNIRWCGVGY
ncbi:MAG: hypothetical protein PF572_06630 [Patescibacteria group bacterium]|jgi:hypothetical protein|nr:hypothetical protein [Patescibacteria group bacterium]